MRRGQVEAIIAPWDCGAWHPEYGRWCTRKTGHGGAQVSENPQRRDLATLTWPRSNRKPHSGKEEG